MDRAGGITVTPVTTDMVVVGISLSGAPRCGVSIDCGAAGVGDSHEVEGENAGRSRCRAGIGDAAFCWNNHLSRTRKKHDRSGHRVYLNYVEHKL